MTDTPARVLVVDDEDAIVDLLTSLLEGSGYHVTSEHDGDKALARVQQERFNLVVTDKNLPGASGLDIIRAATEADPLVECILVTGYGSMESAIAAMEAGAFDYILKPFSSLGELRARVTRALDHQKLKRENRELAEFLTSVVTNMASCLLVVDREGRLRAVNPPALAAAGLSRAEAPEGVALSRVLGKEVAAAFLVPSERVNGQAIPHETTLTRKDGRRIGIGFTSSEMRSPDGVPTGYVVTFRDLSELKQAQEDERRRDRLASMGEMSARIAHEVRNPLVSIDSVVRLLDDDLKSMPEARTDLQTISREVRRLHGIVSEILQYTGRKPSTLIPGDVVALMQSVVTQMQDQFKARQIALKLTVGRDLPDISFDADRLRQVFLNILLNALDVSPTGSAVKVSMEDAGGSPFQGIRVTIDDTGPGIHPDIEARLFTPFASTKTRGTGLGLAVCRGIVEEHRGKITLATRDKGGSGGARAEIVLPAGVKGS